MVAERSSPTSAPLSMFPLESAARPETASAHHPRMRECIDLSLYPATQAPAFAGTKGRAALPDFFPLSLLQGRVAHRSARRGVAPWRLKFTAKSRLSGLPGGRSAAAAGSL